MEAPRSINKAVMGGSTSNNNNYHNAQPQLRCRYGLQVQNIRGIIRNRHLWHELKTAGCTSISSVAFTHLLPLSTHSLDVQFQDEAQSRPNHHRDHYKHYDFHRQHFHDFHCQDSLQKYGGYYESEVLRYLHVWGVGSKDAGSLWRLNWGSIDGRRSRQGPRRVCRPRGRRASGLDELNGEGGDKKKNTINTYDGNPLSERWLQEQLRETV